MTREIKFRAWDKKVKKLIDWSWFVDNIVVEMFENTNLELMQYTGLKDRDGVEIYEGDIVHIVKDRFGKGKHGVWSVEYGCFGDPNVLYVYNQINSCRLVTYDVDEWNFIDKDNVIKPVPHFVASEDKIEMKVIGNIYENPELLTKEKLT